MKRRITAMVLTLFLIMGLLTGCSSEIKSSDAQKGVVRVMAIYNVTYTSADGNEETLAAYQRAYYGSAFGVGKAGETTNIYVTNQHVIDNEIDEYGTLEDGTEVYHKEEFVCAYILKDDYAYTEESGLDLSRVTPCDILYKAEDGEADLAVLKSADILEDRVALPLLDPDYELEVGNKVIAAGYPGTTDDASSDTSGSVERATVTEGTISVFRPVTDEGADFDTIQHTATINHGNSGGPLLTSTGEVAGVNTWGIGGDDGTGDTPTNNALEIKYVTKVLDDLDIDYDVRKPGLDSRIVIGAAAAVIVVIIILVVVLVKKKKRRAAETKNDSASGQGASSGKAAPGSDTSSPRIPGDTGLRIQATSGVFSGKRFAIAGQLRIGRDPARNDLVYPADTHGVSGVHCVLIYQDGQLYLQDLGSTYGTFLGNGKRLIANQAVALQIGDKFSLGSQQECFTVTGKGGI